MSTSPPPLRRALIAGATGLVGRELLPLLLASQRYAQVQVLLRRPTADLPHDPRLAVQVVDFQSLPSLPPVDDVFIALGTTIKVAGSQAAFRAVDFDAVVHTAQAACSAGASRLGVVSALGANASSGVFYNRVKGEMEAAVSALGFESVVIVQPSLLVGDRERLGQPVRPGEVWGARLLGWLPRSVRPIAARQVAEALLREVARGEPGVRRLRSGELR
ncbi:NAD(P)H-binding protein [Piscinibacter gummiphilus]|uniref:NAD(P)H-binding protein n=1 Tax=Piscinibacter gummiphilus TaxID=946333 RepID=A0ABZ0CV46_9BURK|nr:NAD(P)H-binding protein [Piscinibacter gummiphilus]WOB06840.1 NAD(P)H-binding protein [Piscinibacter gummiphilus]